jgi:hypothetical protein
LCELKALAELQDTDEKLAVIRNRVTKGQPTDQTQFVLKTMYYIAGERKLNGDTGRC